MSTTTTSLQYQNVLYYFNNFTLNANGKTLDIPNSMIGTIEINKCFDSQIYPLYYIPVNVPLWMYEAMCASPSNITVTMTLQSKLIDPDQSTFFTSSGFTTEITGTFKVVVPEISSIADSTIQTKVESSVGATDASYAFNEYYMVELSIYNIAAWNASFDSINAVLTSTNVTNALTYCLQRAGISNVLLDKANNSTTYSEFKILPTTTIKNALRIIEDYSFHSTDTIFFFDLTQGYVLSKATGCRVWTNNEYTCTRIECLSATNDGITISGGVMKDTENKINIIGVSKDSVKVEKLDDAPLLRQSQNTFVTVNLSDVQMSMLTPNKDFIISFEGDRAAYNGRYILHEYNMVLKPTGDYYTVSADVVLRC